MIADRYIEQLVSYQKMTKENWQNSATFSQAMAFETGLKLMDLSQWIPDENTAYVKKLQTYATKALKRFNTYLDDTFSVYEKLLVSSRKQPSPKPKSPKQSRTEGKE